MRQVTKTELAERIEDVVRGLAGLGGDEPGMLSKVDRHLHSRLSDLYYRISELEGYVAGHASSLAGLEKAAGGALWRTASGDLLSIRDMTDAHIRNCIEFLKHPGDRLAHVAVAKAPVFLPLFEAELKRREEARKFETVEPPMKLHTSAGSVPFRLEMKAGGPAVRDDGDSDHPVGQANLEQIIHSGIVFPSEAVSMAKEIRRLRRAYADLAAKLAEVTDTQPGDLSRSHLNLIESGWPYGQHEQAMAREILRRRGLASSLSSLSANSQTNSTGPSGLAKKIEKGAA